MNDNSPHSPPECHPVDQLINFLRDQYWQVVMQKEVIEGKGPDDQNGQKKSSLVIHETQSAFLFSDSPTEN